MHKKMNLCILKHINILDIGNNVQYIGYMS